ncbi:MAG TPA: hypothetical protein VD838_01440 [Anaeromyxobacteraceae bacterium]|nr:hypothetical protein [Anaeromyxobacteraceae bacterium]
MNATDLVPSLETCRALKAAGFPQGPRTLSDPTPHPLLLWRVPYGKGAPYLALNEPAPDSISEECAAPTLAEALAALPPYIYQFEREHDEYRLSLGPLNDGRVRVEYLDTMEGMDDGEIPYSDNANAAEAAALLYLALAQASLLPAPAEASL